MTGAPTPRDLDFLLYEVLHADALTARPRHADYSREAFDQIIATARALAEEQFAPHRKANDEHEPSYVDGRVVMTPEVAPAVKAVADAGFIAATHDADVGGLQLPHTFATAMMFHLEAANVGTAAYALLATGVANLLAAFGSADQKRRFLLPLLEGRFLGTMALSEPDAGSSLADVRVRAEPLDDGRFALTGTKMWISGGDHELSENIVHLVLGRIAGAPAGVKGISLFIVPKRRVDDQGKSGDLNGVVLGGLIHKLGWRGTVNTVLNFGEREACIGELVGQPHHGLQYMFHMMNEARIGVGRAAAAMGYEAYRYALDYARTRRQGRLPGEKNPQAPQVPIIEHPDVRRMLLAQKATVEAALHLVLHCAHLVDEQETGEDPAARRRATLLLEVLTPIAKAWPSEACQESISHAMQVLGGYGYAREYPIEQLWRDNRINPIHEGTNGIQALDLLGRKVRLEEGASFKALVAEMQRTVAAATSAGGDAAALAAPVGVAVARLAETTLALAKASATVEPARALANASAYLDLASRTVVAWLWLEQATAATRALATASADDAAFYRGKLQAARYWMGWELPRTEALAALLVRMDAVPYEMQDAWF
ncbi:MAG: acyl-CoA dehydrogenase [Gemmatimonadetes bacterium]|nr:acyl-CoA dehydrogenase [Gemmatimonadota bacterium]